MAIRIPPTPINAPQGSYAWLDYHQKVNEYLNTDGALSWTNIDFAGSDITDITNRSHNVMQSIQGGTTGEYYHLTATQHTALVTWSGKTVPTGVVVGTTDTQVLSNKELTSPLMTGAEFADKLTVRSSGGGSGKATLVAGTVTVNNTNVTADTIIILTPQNSSGTVGHARVTSVTAGTSFTITSTSATDTSTIGYLLIEPS